MTFPSILTVLAAYASCPAGGNGYLGDKCNVSVGCRDEGVDGNALFCSGGICATVKKTGVSCGGAGECGKGICLDSVCTGYRTLGPGQSCTDDILCKGGYCSAATQKCVKWVEAGQTCSASAICNPGFFTQNQYTFRDPDDPERSETAEPLYCHMTGTSNTGVCKAILFTGEGGDCKLDKTNHGNLRDVSYIDQLDVIPGYCTRGTYPKIEALTCKCSRFISEGGQCRFMKVDVGGSSEYILLDDCEYGTRCVLLTQPTGSESLVVGKCVKFIGGKKGVKYYVAPGEANFDRSILCPEGSEFDPVEGTCDQVEGMVCQSDADCPKGVCDMDCTGVAGRCKALSSVCIKQHQETASYLYDRAILNRSLISSPYGTFTGTLKSLGKKYKTLRYHQCCLFSTYPPTHALHYDFNLQQHDLTNTCAKSTSPFLLILTLVLAAIGLGSFTVILTKDIIPSSRAQGQDAPETPGVPASEK